MDNYEERVFTQLDSADAEAMEAMKGELPLDVCERVCARGPLTGCEAAVEDGRKGVVCVFTYNFGGQAN